MFLAVELLFQQSSLDLAFLSLALYILSAFLSEFKFILSTDLLPRPADLAREISPNDFGDVIWDMF